MVNTVQHKRGTTAQVNSYTGSVGEFIYNTTTKRIHAQDGVTAGGVPHALVSEVNLKANESVTISAGAGLTGGGTLAANRTLALSSASIASLALADSSVQSVNGKTGSSITLTKADVGLSNVDNTSDASKPVSTATQTALNAKANSSVTVSAGTGLTGGGNLTANRSLALNSASIASLGKADTALQAPGGTAGQILAKSSAADNDVGWVSSEAATAVSYGPQTLTGPQKTQAKINLDLQNVPNKTEAQMVASGAIANALGGKLPTTGKAADSAKLDGKTIAQLWGAMGGAIHIAGDSAYARDANGFEVVSGTALVTTNAAGGFGIILPAALGSLPFSVIFTDGDRNSGGSKLIYPIRANHSQTYIQGIALNLTGNAVASMPIRVDYIATGRKP